MEEALALSWRRIPERYGLVGNSCSVCKENFFPPRRICPNCRRKGNLSEKKFSGKGKVYTYSRVNVVPQGFELDAPYILAIIELEEGAKITGQIADCKDCDVKIGTPVELAFRKINEDGPEGIIHYGYKFRIRKE